MKLRGDVFLRNMLWKAQILKLHQNASKKLSLLEGLRFTLPRKTLATLFKSIVRSTVEHTDVVWDGCITGKSDLFENI